MNIDFGEYKYVCGMCKNYNTDKCEWCGANGNFEPINADQVPDFMIDHYKKVVDHYNNSMINEKTIQEVI